MKKLFAFCLCLFCFAAPGWGEPIPMKPDAAADLVGRAVVFQGVAQNAKLAAVLTADGFVLYCLDRDEWPADLIGRRLKVIGTLERTDEFKASTDSSGAISAGTSGTTYVLRSSRLLEVEVPLVDRSQKP